MSAVSTAAAPAHRLGFGASLRHGLTLTRRSLLKIKANPEEVIGLTIQPIMFVALFVFIFGQALAGSWQEYRDFALPGIIVQTVVFATMGTGLSLNSDIEKGIFDRFRSLPIARSAPLVGAVLGDLVRYTLSVLVITVIGVAIGFRLESLTGTLAAVALILVFAFALCWMSALVGLMARSVMGVQMFAMTLMFPLTFGSSIFVAADKMPSWLQPVIEVNPITHLTESVRGLIAGNFPAGDVVTTLVWSAVFFAVFFPLAVWRYKRRT